MDLNGINEETARALQAGQSVDIATWWGVRRLELPKNGSIAKLVGLYSGFSPLPHHAAHHHARAVPHKAVPPTVKSVVTERDFATLKAQFESALAQLAALKGQYNELAKSLEAERKARANAYAALEDQFAKMQKDLGERVANLEAALKTLRENPPAVVDNTARWMGAGGIASGLAGLALIGLAFFWRKGEHTPDPQGVAGTPGDTTEQTTTTLAGHPEQAQGVALATGERSRKTAGSAHIGSTFMLHIGSEHFTSSRRDAGSFLITVSEVDDSPIGTMLKGHPPWEAALPEPERGAAVTFARVSNAQLEFLTKDLSRVLGEAARNADDPKRAHVRAWLNERTISLNIYYGKIPDDIVVSRGAPKLMAAV